MHSTTLFIAAIAFALRFTPHVAAQSAVPSTHVCPANDACGYPLCNAERITPKIFLPPSGASTPTPVRTAPPTAPPSRRTPRTRTPNGALITQPLASSTKTTTASAARRRLLRVPGPPV